LRITTLLEAQQQQQQQKQKQKQQRKQSRDQNQQRDQQQQQQLTMPQRMHTLQIAAALLALLQTCMRLWPVPMLTARAVDAVVPAVAAMAVAALREAEAVVDSSKVRPGTAHAEVAAQAAEAVAMTAECIAAVIAQMDGAPEAEVERAAKFLASRNTTLLLAIAVADAAYVAQKQVLGTSPASTATRNHASSSSRSSCSATQAAALEQCLSTTCSCCMQ
jgi:hypothetical protein